MRCDQHMGLSNRGQEIFDKLVSDHRVTVQIKKETTWPDGITTTDSYEEHRPGYIEHQYDHYIGMFGDKHQLLEYRTSSGELICSEYVQVEPWSDVFLGIERC